MDEITFNGSNIQPFFKVANPPPKASGTPVFLDTLAQLPPSSGKTSIKTLQKRAKSKWWTQAIVLSLVDLKSPLNKYYWNAYHCNHKLTQSGQELTGKYCNSRICHVCNRIRTAKMINGYCSQLNGRPLEFVTLTVPNCSAEELDRTINRMTKTFTLINRNLREKKGIILNGVRKIEVTVNLIENNYHPHLHLIVDGHGQTLVDSWLQRFPECSKKAQKVQIADEESLHELFKYTTKIIDYQESEKSIVVYGKHLDVIMLALRNKRTFQPFGDIKKVSEEVVDDLKGKVYDVPEYDYMVWEYRGHDWYNKKNIPLTQAEQPTQTIIYK